ncbi:MAG: YdcF family protein [Alphaproteobacteria bacterium]|jgi:uncharacterized SAM-binding protein YcdF (DUF218 family)
MRILTSSLITLILIAGGAVIFKVSTPSKCASIRGDDTLFVLTGDSRRIPYAMKLLEHHPHRRLEIIGVGGHEYAALIPDNIKQQVSLETLSKTTHENAKAVREITIKKRLSRIVVITTEDHMNRSMLLIKRQLPNTSIIPCPVKLQNMQPEKRLIRWTMEYLKYIATLIGLESKA